MEQDPSSVPNESSKDIPASMRRAIQERDSVQQRLSIKRWYEARRETARRRREERIARRAEQSTAGLLTFRSIGRWAVNRAAKSETDPRVREHRRAILQKKWKEFTRRAFLRNP